MSDDKYPHESLTEEEARRRHPDCEFVGVYSIFDQNDQRRQASSSGERRKTRTKCGSSCVCTG